MSQKSNEPKEGEEKKNYSGLDLFLFLIEGIIVVRVRNRPMKAVSH